MSFIRTGLREVALKIKRQRTRMALRHQRRLLQRSEINLGREGTAQAVNFPELRNEIIALKKLEQEQKELALRIGQLEEGIRRIEAERQENTAEQNTAVAKLETEKKPLLQRRNEAKSTADVCERELAGVERRIQENERADRDLLKQVSDLHALEPAPTDLQARAAAITARRARLPDERAELVRARLGSADAARLAREKLAAAEAELAVMDKTTERVRTEFEARDRKLNENIRAQQEAVRDARARHHRVEERKTPAYLNIGRHLASQGIAPPNAPHLLKEAHRHRDAVDQLLRQRAELTMLSGQIDRQELRKFYFSILSVLALLAIVLPVAVKSPRKREWLPQETDLILSINIEQLERADAAKRWRKEQPQAWPKVWSGLIGAAAAAPGLSLPRDAVHITRAVDTNESATPREFIVMETRRDVSRVIRAIGTNPTFHKRAINGLPVWDGSSDFAVARIGPATLAIGTPAEVDELVLVRLGMKPDLKITDQLFNQFQALDRESAVRLISRNPPDLSRVFEPVFPRELLDASQLLGLAVSLQNPVKAKLLLKMVSSKEPTEFARNLHDQPQRWLRLADSELLLYSQLPEIQKKGNSNLEVHFTVPDNSARLLLERIAKTGASPGLTAY